MAVSHQPRRIAGRVLRLPEDAGRRAPRKFLTGFKGYLHVDGNSGYHKMSGATLVGCWAQPRRKYDEALKAEPQAQELSGTVAGRGLAYCNALFTIERDLKGSTPEERYAERQKRSLPVV